MSIQQLKSEADTLSEEERRELIGYLIGLGRKQGARVEPSVDRRADFLAWADRPRPRVGLREAGREAIYEG